MNASSLGRPVDQSICAMASANGVISTPRDVLHQSPDSPQAQPSSLDTVERGRNAAAWQVTENHGPHVERTSTLGLHHPTHEGGIVVGRRAFGHDDDAKLLAALEALPQPVHILYQGFQCELVLR